MEQFGGCYYGWFEDKELFCCLLGTRDDASGRITRLEFVHDKGVKPVFSFGKNILKLMENL